MKRANEGRQETFEGQERREEESFEGYRGQGSLQTDDLVGVSLIKGKLISIYN